MSKTHNHPARFEIRSARPAAQLPTPAISLGGRYRSILLEPSDMPATDVSRIERINSQNTLQNNIETVFAFLLVMCLFATFIVAAGWLVSVAVTVIANMNFSDLTYRIAGLSQR